MQWLEQANDMGAARPPQPLWPCVLKEAALGLLGAQVSLEYMRSTLGCGRPLCGSWKYAGFPWHLALGTVAGASRGCTLATGGKRPRLQHACSWAEFLLEVFAERECACLLGFPCAPLHYAAVALWGVLSLLPWGLLVVPCDRLVVRVFGEDPIAEQKCVLEQVALELEHSRHGNRELAAAPRRAAEFIGRVELTSLWRHVRPLRATSELVREARKHLRPQDSVQRRLEVLLRNLAEWRAAGDVRAILTGRDGRPVREDEAFHLLEAASAPILVPRKNMVRSALTQVADRPLEHLLLGIAARSIPGLQRDSTAQMLGLRVQFAGEEGFDLGGVRKEFMDCFAKALVTVTPQASPLALLEPVTLLALCADSTWRPAPCREEQRGYLWALGRLLALALVYRCPCPLPLSLLVFKCLLGITLRPGDVRRLDPDFWNHRVRPLLAPGGADTRQAQLVEWGMDPLAFTSADGARELRPGGAKVLVNEENREEYAQLLCEDLLLSLLLLLLLITLFLYCYDYYHHH